METESLSPSILDVQEAKADSIYLQRRGRSLKTLKWSGIGFGALLAITLLWLIFFVPVSKSAQPIVPPRIVLLTRDGQPFAQQGPLMEASVKVAALPPYVAQAFFAIEDRRFPSHWGFDAVGIARSIVNNFTGGGRQGGSTITQQLAKNVYLIGADGRPARTYGRKLQEIAIAMWLELWLTKDEILERYLSNVQFGNNVYGLRAASLHYFYRQPEKLTLEQAVMLAGLVQAPNRFEPTRNLERAQKRAQMVLNAMTKTGYLTEARAKALHPAELDVRTTQTLPTGTYFADWALPAARARAGIGYTEQRVTTTLDADLLKAARKAVEDMPLPGSEVALVAMRTNGEVVAMLGGRDYGKPSVLNRAVQSRRQPGSTFKLFTYLTALQQGLSAKTEISNAPIEEGEYRPANADGRYSGTITLGDAFARSSNVAAVRLFQQVGASNVIETAHELGISEQLAPDSSLALGSSGVSLLNLTSAYAAIAAGDYPIHADALVVSESGFLSSPSARPQHIDEGALVQIRGMLRRVVTSGTGTAAALPIPAFGKTGTSQDYRDAWFVGYAGDLVVGVWIGFDDNRPMDGVTGGGIPAEIWHRFMVAAIAANKIQKANSESGSRGASPPMAAPSKAAPPKGAPPAPDSGGGFIGDDGQPVILTRTSTRVPLQPPSAARGSGGDGRPARVVGRPDISVTLDPDSQDAAQGGGNTGRTPARSQQSRPQPQPTNRPARFRARDGSVVEVELRD